MSFCGLMIRRKMCIRDRDRYGWMSLLLCLVGAVVIYIANRVIDEKIEVKK